MYNGKIAVLVVEDSPGDLVLARRRLQSVDLAHFDITPASNLGAALEQVRDGADVVLLDLDLPDSFGLNTLRKLRAQNPTVPIIVLTGSLNREKAKEALVIGAQDYLLKDEIDGYSLGKAILRQVQKSRE